MTHNNHLTITPTTVTRGRIPKEQPPKLWWESNCDCIHSICTTCTKLYKHQYNFELSMHYYVFNITAPFLINTYKTHVWCHGGPQPCGCCQLSDSHMHGLFEPHLSPQPRGFRTRVLVGLILLSEASLISMALRAALQHVPDRTRYWQTWSLHEAKQSPEAWGKSLRRLNRKQW